MTALKTNRTLLRKDYFWLPYDVPKGTEVDRYFGPTYGVLDKGSIAVYLPGEEGFYQVPEDSVVPVWD